MSSTPSTAAFLPRSVSLLREFSIPLIAGILIALAWANLSPDSYHAAMTAPFAGLTLEFVVNELFMALFFGIAAVEITDSFVPGGSMNPPRKAITPLLATAGGVLGPVAIYFLLNALFGSPLLLRGWGITTATDIALAWLVARLIFPQGHPAISFLLLLAIADDAIGLAIIALFYPDPAHALAPAFLLLVAAGILIAFALRRFNIASYWPYLLGGGIPAWLGLYYAHLHPALALVVIVPFMPHTRHDPHHTAFDLPDVPTTPSTLGTFEHQWKIVVDFGLLLFGLANAGVQLSSVATITVLVFVSLLLGKTLGIFGFAQLARLLGSPLPEGMTARDLFLVSMTASLGLTVALFVAGAAFADPTLQGAAKMGALASILTAPLVLLTHRLLPPR